MIALALAAATVLPPAGPWNVQAEENSCILVRPYAVADKRVSLAFQRLFGSSHMTLVILEPAKSDTSSYEGQTAVRVQPSARKADGHYFSLVHNGQRVTTISLSASTMENLGSENAIAVSTRPSTHTFGLTAFAKAQAALDKCEADLLTEWGVDPATREPGHAPKVVGDVSRYFGPDSYPSAARDDNAVGGVTALLKLDEKAAVTDCIIINGAGPVFNSAICAKARTMRLEPGRSANGSPAKSVYVLSVRWMLPG